MADYESVLCVKNEVFVYQIPARTSNRGYRAADWKLDEPDWSGRLKVVAKGRDLTVKLEDKNSGELFAQCPVDSYPTPVVEQVLDSSRYFVVRIQDGSGRHAFIGLGFADRGDSFDLLVSLQDHFKHVKRDDTQKFEAASASDDAQSLTAQPKLDLSFKEGQTIKLNFATKKTGDAGAAKPRPKGGALSGAVLLPPPPGGSKVTAVPTRPTVAPPADVSPVHQQQSPAFVKPSQPSNNTRQPVSSNLDLLVDFGVSLSNPNAPHSQSFQQTSVPTRTAADGSNDWDDFAGALSSKLTIQPQPSASSQAKPSAKSWENFE